jgi:hypothetical protein
MAAKCDHQRRREFATVPLLMSYSGRGPFDRRGVGVVQKTALAQPGDFLGRQRDHLAFVNTARRFPHDVAISHAAQCRIDLPRATIPSVGGPVNCLCRQPARDVRLGHPHQDGFSSRTTNCRGPRRRRSHPYRWHWRRGRPCRQPWPGTPPNRLGASAGAGLPILAVAYGVYWLVRRRRKPQ